jgi:uncharacterized protein DUF4332
MGTEPNPQAKKSAEWEETLTAVEPEPEPTAPTPLAPEPEPESALDDLLPPPTEAPPPLEPLAPPTDAMEPDGGPEEPVEADDVPAEWRPYVKREGSAYVLKEPYLDRKTRARLEAAFTKQRGVKLVERRWIPTKREPVHEIEREVDALAFKGRYEPKSVAWLNQSSAAARQAMRGLERVPANIVSKRVVYETEGGFVVEVAYRELGQVRKKYFTVPAAGTRAALDAVESGTYAKATAVSDDLIDAVHTPRSRGQPKVGPGKVLTWPIRNRHRVEALGLNRRQARAVARIGIHSTDQLRLRSPFVLARHLGVPLDEARKLHHVSELLLLKGMQERYARLLAQAGVKGIDGTRRLSPTALMDRVNARLKTQKGKRPPALGRARATQWVRAAKSMRKTKQAFPA